MAFTEDQMAQLSAPLDRKHVKSRDQGRGKVSYIEGWHAIAEANRIFGFDGWSRETVSCECCGSGPYEKAVWENGKRTDRTMTSYRCSYRARVRVRVGDIIREGSGHGHGFSDNPGEAHESAEKEAETDAMKRALMTFGNPFGLALYDKTQAEVSDNPRGGPEPEASTHAAPLVTPATNGAVVGGGRTVGSIPATGAKETAAQRIVREIDEAKYPTTVTTILAGNQGKFARWSETPEGEAVVRGINERANAKLAELGA